MGVKAALLLFVKGEIENMVRHLGIGQDWRRKGNTVDHESQQLASASCSRSPSCFSKVLLGTGIANHVKLHN
jgi:hypothetical protein